MKHLISAIILLAIVLLVACAIPPNSSVPPITENATAVLPVISTTSTPAQTTASNASEASDVRNLVKNFGKRLQNVSLLAPDAAQEIKNQYSEYVSPTLLEMWMNNVSEAPGRVVSSPWPDHIEITTLSKESSDRYEVSGDVIEVTSTEIINGGAATKIPVRVVVQKDQGRWYIADYEEER